MWGPHHQSLTYLSLLLLIFALQSAAQQFWARRDPVSIGGRFVPEGVQGENVPQYKWTEEWVELPIDNFAFTDSRKFKLRYLLNTEHFKNKNAPIFFYTGNEGKIEGFAVNTGLMWDLAPEFGAAIVFAEHRFYGKSYPFGNSSYANVSNLGYLSSEQALADFAQLIVHLREEKLPNARKSPVIAFGGSYGGMLTAWMRVKYPHLVDGGIASSAPVFWFSNVPSPPEDAYDRIVSRTFKLSGCTVEGLKQSLDAIREMAKSEKGRQFLNENFRLANESKLEKATDGEKLVGAVKDVMDAYAMVDYPYPTNFLAPLPGWPVQEACRPFKLAHDAKDFALAAYKMLNLFYNYTGSQRSLCLWGEGCAGPFSQLGDPDGWPWQSCTEMIMPMCTQGPPKDPFDHTCPYQLKDSLRWCQDYFGRIGFDPALFRPQWAITNYGADFPTASNLVFSNGWLDPWSGGGWRMKPCQEGTLVSLIVEDGAHHYDLRGESPEDTDSVKEVRRLEKMHIQRWIAQAEERQREQKKVTRERILRAELEF